MKKNKILVALILLAASCGPLGKYEPASEAEQPSQEPLAKMAWNEVFTDPCLQDLINIALENNIDLQAAQEHINQARASLTGAKMQYTPSLNLTPNIYGQIREGSNPAYTYYLTADASWQIDIFGRIANSVKSAKATVSQMEDYKQAVRVSLIAQVASTYYTLLMLDTELKTSREMENTWKKSVETIGKLKREGFADEVAVNQYIATYASICIISKELEKQIKITENAISLILCQPAGQIKRGSLYNQRLPQDIVKGVPVQLLTCRPDVKAAQRDVEIAFYTTKAAWLNFFPTLSISGTSAGLFGVFGEAVPMTALANLSASLVAPVFNLGTNRAKLKIAESRQQEAKLNLDKALLTAGTEVNNALVEYNTYSEKTDFFKVQVASLIKARQDTETLMQNSEGKTYLDVLTAHNALIEATFDMIENYAFKMNALVSFYESIGGGSE